MGDVHVVPDGDGWKVEHDGNVDGAYATQQAAIAAGRDVAETAACELVVHGRDGQIRIKDSESNDLHEIPG